MTTLDNARLPWQSLALDLGDLQALLNHPEHADAARLSYCMRLRDMLALCEWELARLCPKEEDCEHDRAGMAGE